MTSRKFGFNFTDSMDQTGNGRIDLIELGKALMSVDVEPAAGGHMSFSVECNIMLPFVKQGCPAMANYSINTCFRLDWPKDACDSLKQAMDCVHKEVSMDGPEFQALGPETRKMDTSENCVRWGDWVC
jgi:hypothetical protein